MEAHAKKLEQQLTDAQAEGKRLQALAGVCKAQTCVLVEPSPKVLAVLVHTRLQAYLGCVLVEQVLLD